MARLTINELEGGGSYMSLIGRFIRQECVIQFCRPFLPRGGNCFLKYPINLSIGDFHLSIGLRMVRGRNSVPNSIFG